MHRPWLLRQARCARRQDGRSRTQHELLAMLGNCEAGMTFVRYFVVMMIACVVIYLLMTAMGYQYTG
jgi:hypothetical protein